MVEPTWEIRQGDVLERLREMPDESVHCVVTSPPYWGLRDYGTAEWQGGDSECDHISRPQVTEKAASNRGALRDNPYKEKCGKCGAIRVDCQIGLEQTPEAYVAKIVAVFREVRRVLRSSGTCWLNLGDSYASAWTTSRRNVVGEGSLIDGSRNGGQRPNRLSENLKEKDLVGIPWMTAFALRADGWYLRSDCIWSKPNPMPESVTDRPTKSHEYVFLLTKSARYFFDAEAVKEAGSLNSHGGGKVHDGRYSVMSGRNDSGQCAGDARPAIENGGRNIRSVWNIATQPFNEAHFATFPERLVDRCISAGTSEKGVCGECGNPWVRVLDVKPMEINRSDRSHEMGRTRSSGTMTTPRISSTAGWQQQCDHDTPLVPATVLDIFSGSGTTGVVANKLGRNYIGIELNPQYVAMSERRLSGTIYQPSLFA